MAEEIDLDGDEEKAADAVWDRRSRTQRPKGRRTVGGKSLPKEGSRKPKTRPKGGKQ